MLSNYCVSDLNFESSFILIDVGANVGEFSIASSLYLNPDVRIISFEPDTTDFAALAQNCKKFGSQNNSCFNYALSNSSGEFDFYLNNDSGDSSLLNNTNYKKKVTVEVRTLDEVMKAILSPHERVGLIKLEAEGWEPEVLMGAELTLRRTMYVAGDLGPERFGESTYRTCKEILENFGFTEILSKNHRYLFKNSELAALEEKGR
jgi:FkbM family methyltransferase